MNVRATAELISNKFLDRKPRPPIFTEYGGKGLVEFASVELLVPWENCGETVWAAVSFSIARQGIVASISISDQNEPDKQPGKDKMVYTGCSVDRAYTSVLQWLWRHAALGHMAGWPAIDDDDDYDI